jgi:hypothetical protein
MLAVTICGFFLRVVKPPFVGTFLVSDKLQEVRDIVGAALSPMRSTQACFCR